MLIHITLFFYILDFEWEVKTEEKRRGGRDQMLNFVRKA